MAPSTLQERKRRVTRDHIERVALQLFAQRGYEGTTIEDIAEAAGISGRTFFRYFPAKEDVVFADHPDQLARFAEALRTDESDDSPPVRALRALQATNVTTETAELKVRRSLYAVPAVRDRSHRLAAEYKAVFAEHLMERDPSIDRVDAALVTGAIWGAHMTVFELVGEEGREPSTEHVMGRAVELLQRGIR